MKTTKDDSWLLNVSVRISGRRTTIRLEPEMWRALRSVAAREDCHPDDVFAHIEKCKPAGATPPQPHAHFSWNIIAPPAARPAMPPQAMAS